MPNYRLFYQKIYCRMSKDMNSMSVNSLNLNRQWLQVSMTLKNPNNAGTNSPIELTLSSLLRKDFFLLKNIIRVSR